jgi:hypothetical protein
MLDDAVFKQRPEIRASAMDIRCHGTRFLEGVYLRLRWADILLNDADFAGPSILTGAYELEDSDLRQREADEIQHWRTIPDVRPRISSLSRANVLGLSLSSVDLHHCVFKDAHNLDKLRLELQSEAFTVVPRGRKPGRAKRQQLVEEHVWRSNYEQRWWSRFYKRRGSRGSARQEARRIASLYRYLRKGREDNKDEPGAADFYYGEMEMRRKAASNWAERGTLFLYWLFSGYALRASRAIVALLLVVALFAVLFETNGFSNPQDPFKSTSAAVGTTTPSNTPDSDVPLVEASISGLTTLDNLVFAASAATGVIGGPEVQLTKQGRAYRVLLRIIGPLLLALAILAVRGRVKR